VYVRLCCIQNSSNHCAFLAQIPEANDSSTSPDVLLSWFSGYREGWDETRIVVSRLVVSTSKWTWTDAEVVSSAKGFSAQNPVMLVDSSIATDETTLYLFHTRQPKGNKNVATRQQGNLMPTLKPDPVPSQVTARIFKK
jgi:predicted neuraminidase